MHGRQKTQVRMARTQQHTYIWHTYNIQTKIIQATHETIDNTYNTWTKDIQTIYESTVQRQHTKERHTNNTLTDGKQPNTLTGCSKTTHEKEGTHAISNKRTAHRITHGRTAQGQHTEGWHTHNRQHTKRATHRNSWDKSITQMDGKQLKH